MKYLWPVVFFSVSILGAGCHKPEVEEDPFIRFEPTWKSLKQYSIPDWYADAKFGIVVHWGPSSVPGFGNEWYSRNMYLSDTEEFMYHQATFGPQTEFGYKDFFPLFKGEKWDPHIWAELFFRAGAKYVVQVAEHHDGFSMYDNRFTRWDSKEMGPGRDVVGELGAAVRERGLMFGVSSHRAEHWHHYPHDPQYDTGDAAYADLYGPVHDPENPPDPDYIEDWYRRTIDLIDHYQPDLLRFGTGFLHPRYENYRKDLGAYYYNKGLEWGKDVVLNYQNDGYPPGTAVLDLEKRKFKDTRDMVWQTRTSIGRKSWGYIQDEIYKSADEIIDELVDIVSKNGVLLLNVAPRPDGIIPSEQEHILLEIGRWLELNGEAIYGTRPWTIFGENLGDTEAKSRNGSKDQTSSTADIRFTSRGDTLYAITLDWPDEGALTIQSLATYGPHAPRRIRNVELLGSTALLKWERNERGLHIFLPENRPCPYACVFRVQ